MVAMGDGGGQDDCMIPNSDNEILLPFTCPPRQAPLRMVTQHPGCFSHLVLVVSWDFLWFGRVCANSPHTSCTLFQERKLQGLEWGRDFHWVLLDGSGWRRAQGLLPRAGFHEQGPAAAWGSGRLPGRQDPTFGPCVFAHLSL